MPGSESAVYQALPVRGDQAIESDEYDVLVFGGMWKKMATMKTPCGRVGGHQVQSPRETLNEDDGRLDTEMHDVVVARGRATHMPPQRLREGAPGSRRTINRRKTRRRAHCGGAIPCDVPDGARRRRG